ncbi:hypothetical protein PWJ82_08785 [Actinotignum schaalii]|uniref:hypothetical protein n=1 Tax=Actinotignum schaalii TaxID=59505 RepID=UPI00237D7641|nr:hypothetical protein [Actinotignum schaalii]MDE1655321.1 hypothetical protein [Actinotignum schaalii]
MSALRLWGVPLPPHLETWDENKQVDLSAPLKRRGHTHPLIRWDRTQLLDSDIETIRTPGGNLRIASRPRAVLASVPDLSFYQLIAAIDALLRIPRRRFEGRSAPYATREGLEIFLAEHPSWNFVAHFRAALAWARVGADSPMETLLRLLIAMAGFPEPRLNQRLLAPDGRSLGQPDMLFEEQRIIVEYDGAPHRAASQQVKDRQRRELRTSYGWIELQVFHPDLHLPRRLVRMMFNPGKPVLPRITSGEVPATARLAEAFRQRGWRVRE